MSFHDNIINKKFLRLAYVGLALLSAVLFDYFFNNHKLGLGLFVFVFIFTYSFLALAFITNQLRQKTALLLTLPILILSFDVVLYNNILVTRFIPWLILILTVLLIVVVTLGNPDRHKFKFLNIPVIKNAGLFFQKLNFVVKDLSDISKSSSETNYRKILQAIAIAIPILLLFTFLFYQADAVFADIFDKIIQINIDSSTVWRILRGFVIFIFLSGLFYATISKEHVLSEFIHKVQKMDEFIVGVVLGLINFLFLLFVFIQIKYLFGSSDYVLQNGITYADYARSGFFQLAFVVVLSFVLLFIIFRSYSRHDGSKAIGAWQLLLTAQVFIIAISALKRMNLYQDAYGFTVLRLYVEWFIYFVIIMLALFAVSVVFRIKYTKLFYIYLVSGLIAIIMVASVNVDRMIARKNIDRYFETGKSLDLSYLIIGLSPDAVPEIQRVYNSGITWDKIADADSFPKAEYLNQGLLKNLGSDIRFLQPRIKDLEKDGGWMEFNFGRDAVKKIIGIN